MIDVHRRKATLVVMGVPQRQLLATMRSTEGVVDVEGATAPFQREDPSLQDQIVLKRVPSAVAEARKHTLAAL